MAAPDISADQQGRWAELVTPRYLFATATVSLGIVLFAFNAFLVATALPTAVKDLGGAPLLSWATSLYLILSILSGTSTALVMHRIGARWMFILSALAFLAGTLVAGLAPSMPVLLAGRALQGVAAGFIEAGCYVLIPRLFPSRLIPKVFGVEAIAWALAAFGGPALAGYLAEAVSWRASLLSAVPLVVVFLALVPVVVARDLEDRRAVQVPWVKLGGIAVGMLLITLASIAGSNAAKFGMLALAAGIFVVTALSDRWRLPRLFPHGAFALNSITGLGFWTALVMPVAQAAAAVFLVYALQFLWQYSALEAGLVGAVMALSWSSSQFLLATFGTARFRLHMIWVGPVLLVAGLAGIAAALALESFATLIAAQVAVGLAFGLNWSPLSQVVMESAPAAERDGTSALLPTIMAAGYGIGAAVFGVVGNALHYAAAEGETLLGVMLAIFLIAAGIGIAAAVTGIRMAVLVLRRGTASFASAGAP
ncbi:MAG: MFS transporter [Alphaproteobacteria bacterium]|nr:MFS transporter [Alphaproteobacteria bacterium]